MKANTFNKIFRDAEQFCLQELADEKSAFIKEARSLLDAIDLACESNVKKGERLVMHSHQRRVGKFALQEFCKKLRGCEAAFNSCQNFEDLHRLIKSQADDVDRVGELTCYDVAERIGWFLGFEASVIYLHAGTRIGAEKLLGAKLGKTLLPEELPSSFEKFSPSEIETLLCVYKDNWAMPDKFSSSKACQRRAREAGSC